LSSVASRLGYLIKRAQYALRSRMDAELRSLGLSTAQYAVLMNLKEIGPASGAELARRCFVRPQTLTALIAGLEKAQMIERAASTSHGRIIESRLTSKGKETLRRADALVKRVEAAMLSNLQPDEQVKLGAMLARCVEGLGATP
jgi:DNA-binding MarR family transcriptional regulator